MLFRSAGALQISKRECKTWTVDYVLDYELDYGLDYGLGSRLDYGRLRFDAFRSYNVARTSPSFLQK